MNNKILISTMILLFNVVMSVMAVWQFLPKDAVTTDNSSLVSLSSSDLVLVPLHAPSNGWNVISVKEKAISFSETSSPLAIFSSNENVEIAKVFIVASLKDITPLATLLDAPSPVRISAAPALGEDWTYDLCGNVYIDGAINSVPSNSCKLFEISFSEPISTKDFYIGNHPATPAWRRGWQGSINEIILCEENLGDEQIRAIRSYLAQKWYLVRQPSHLANEYGILKAMGLRTGNIYRTQMEMR